MPLREPRDPEIETIDRSVRLLEGALHLHVRRDLREGRHPRQPVRLADRVVVGDAMVPPSLDVECREIEAAGPRGSEEKVAHVVHHRRVDLLAAITRQILQDRLHARVRECADIEERIPQRQLLTHGRAVRGEEADVTSEHAVAEPIRGRRELGRDARIDVGPVAAGRTERRRRR